MAAALMAENQKMIARTYQTELLDIANSRNSIICMGTGTGKTFIAVMLIREKAHEMIRKPYADGGKITVFLTTAVALAKQQGEVIAEHTSLKVQVYVGADGVDDWMTEPGRWEVEFNRNQVLVMTAEILKNILQHGLLPMSRINLLIFDECHNAKKKHAYAKIMVFEKESRANGHEVPRILGLTASIVQKDISVNADVEAHVAKIEETLNATAITSVDSEAMSMYGTKPEERILLCENDSGTELNPGLVEIIQKSRTLIDDLKEVFRNEADDEALPRELETLVKYLDEYEITLEVLGPVGADFVARHYHSIIEKDLRSSSGRAKRVIKVASSIFGDLEKEYEERIECECSDPEKLGERCTDKVKALLYQILYSYQDEDAIDPDENRGVSGDEKDESESENVDDDDSEMEDGGLTESDSDEVENSEANLDDELRQKPNEDVAGIVFVERRITALALHKVLQQFFRWDPAICRFESDYIVGVASRGDDVHNTMKQMDDALRRFRKKDINLLISTSVIQEGIDIPKCNLVVLFDVPKNFTQYIQTKGRARAEESKFYVLTTTDEREEITQKLNKYKNLEQRIITMCKNREEKRTKDEYVGKEEDDGDEDEEVPPYKGPVLENGAQAMVTMSSAVSLLNQYCTSLPTDEFTKLVPECTYEQFGDISNGEVPTFRCRIKMPMSCPLREPVTGPVMGRKKLAQMAAALLVCEKLHQSGELNDNLLPVFRRQGLDELLDEESRKGKENLDTTGASADFAHAKAKVISKSKQRMLYERGYSESLKNCLPVAGKEMFLYEIYMTMSAVSTEYKGPRKSPEDSDKNFALLLGRELPIIPDFPIYIRSGEITVKMKLIASDLVLTDEKIRKLVDFHRYVVKNILDIETKFFESVSFDPNNSVHQSLFVPIKNQAIDWKLVGFVLANRDLVHLPKEERDFSWDKGTWKDAVVTRTYGVKPPEFHFVNDIRFDMNPLSEFPDGQYRTFHNYYFHKYNDLMIKNLKQPLLDVSKTSTRMNLLTPRNMTKQGLLLDSGTKERQVTYFVPELCAIHIFPDSMWRKAVCLPSILYRLNGLFMAAELKERIGAEAVGNRASKPPDAKYPRLDFGFKMSERLRPLDEDVAERMRGEDEQLMSEVDELVNKFNDHPKIDEDLAQELANKENEFERIRKRGIFDNVLKIDNAEYGPSPCAILQALTCAGANDFFNLERFEIIGDSFLKYTITTMLFMKYRNEHEGRLNERRTALVRNSYLYELALKNKLEKMVLALPFEPQKNWLPPLYTAKDFEPIIHEGKKGKEDSIEYCMRTRQLMSDKHIADCVEALIGCYLTTSGAGAAMKVLKWLGFEMTRAKIPNPVFKNETDWEEIIEKETADLLAFEKSIGYEFKNKAFLLEAMTHGSYDKNRVTGDYQRLEFLGDAVLDYIITRFLYEDAHQFSPGVLTDLRSALVCNETFAGLAVKYKYHLFFKYRNPNLFYVINKFIKTQKERGFGDIYESDKGRDLNEEEVRIPKVLGDVFESVAGAVYLDSGMSLDTVWDVYYKMMKELVVMVTVKLPKSPIRELRKLTPADAVDFERPVTVQGGRVKVKVTVEGLGTFSALGNNGKEAADAAARKAVTAVKEMQAEGTVLAQV